MYLFLCFCRTHIASSEHHIKQNQNMWTASSSATREDYGEDYFRSFLESMMIHLGHSSRKTYAVVDDMVTAVTAVHPKTRYVTQWFVSVGSDVLGVLPDCLQDLAIRKYMQVPCIPKCMDDQAEKDAV